MLQEFDIESAFCDRYEVIFNDGKDVTNIWTEEMSGRVLVDDGEGESVVIESLQPRLTAVLDPQATYRYQTCDSEVCEEPNPIAIDESIPEACEELTAIAEIYSRA